MSETNATYYCLDCRAGFFVPVREVKWYAKRGWPAPKRCPGCREKRRTKRRDERAQETK